MPGFGSRIARRLRSLTLIECLSIAAIAAVLAALLTPGTQWASSGSVQMPVRVTVFDAATGEPIEGARVAVVKGPLATVEFDPDDYRDRIAPYFGETIRDEEAFRTGRDGCVTIDREFPTGASNVHPEPKAHVGFSCVIVSASRYGTVVTPVRYESPTTESLRQLKHLSVYVGLGNHFGEDE